MGIVSWIFIGLVIGFIAIGKSKSHAFRKFSLLAASLVGALFGWLNVAFLYRVPGAIYELHWIALIASLVGALLAVALVGLLTPQKATVEHEN